VGLIGEDRDMPMSGKEKIERARAKKGMKTGASAPPGQQVMRDVKRTARAGRRHQSR
jgi:hypothetical protein